MWISKGTSLSTTSFPVISKYRNFSRASLQFDINSRIKTCKTHTVGYNPEYMGLVASQPGIVACEQQRSRSACASTSLISTFVISFLKSTEVKLAPYKISIFWQVFRKIKVRIFEFYLLYLALNDPIATKVVCFSRLAEMFKKPLW